MSILQPPTAVPINQSYAITVVCGSPDHFKDKTGVFCPGEPVFTDGTRITVPNSLGETAFKTFSNAHCFEKNKKYTLLGISNSYSLLNGSIGNRLVSIDSMGLVTVLCPESLMNDAEVGDDVFWIQEPVPYRYRGQPEGHAVASLIFKSAEPITGNFNPNSLTTLNDDEEITITFHGKINLDSSITTSIIPGTLMGKLYAKYPEQNAITVNLLL